MGAEDAANFAAHAENAASGQEAVTLLYDEVRRIARAFNVAGPELIVDLVTAERFAFRYLDGPGEPDHARDLFLLTGVTCGLLAVTASDLQQFATSSNYARTALLCADRAGHPALRVWVRNVQGSTARWAGWHHEALRYAQLAAPDAASITGTAAVGRAVREARAQAALGDAERAHAALEVAADARDRIRPDDLDDIGGYLTFSTASSLFCTADALSWLPGHVEAERAAAEAVTAFENDGGPFGDEANSRVDLALARAHARDIDGCNEALRPVLDLPAEHRVLPIRTNLDRVHSVLADPRYHGSAAARDTAAEIEAFGQLAPPTRLPD